MSRLGIDFPHDCMIDLIPLGLKVSSLNLVQLKMAFESSFILLLRSVLVELVMTKQV